MTVIKTRKMIKVNQAFMIFNISFAQRTKHSRQFSKVIILFSIFLHLHNFDFTFIVLICFLKKDRLIHEKFMSTKDNNFEVQFLYSLTLKYVS